MYKLIFAHFGRFSFEDRVACRIYNEDKSIYMEFEKNHEGEDWLKENGWLPTPDNDTVWYQKPSDIDKFDMLVEMMNDGRIIVDTGTHGLPVQQVQHAKSLGFILKVAGATKE